MDTKLIQDNEMCAKYMKRCSALDKDGVHGVLFPAKQKTRNDVAQEVDIGGML